MASIAEVTDGGGAVMRAEKAVRSACVMCVCVCYMCVCVHACATTTT